MDEDNSPICACKVGRVANEYRLEGIHDELQRRWLGEGDEPDSVRNLASYFNKRVLEKTLTDIDMEILDGEADNIYRLLTGDGSSGMKTQARRKLERNGVDIEGLTDDFVSHQSIYRHLRTCLDAKKELSKTTHERIDEEYERLSRLQSRSEAVSEAALDKLHKNGDITLCDHDVIVSFRVACEECGCHREITDLIQDGGCDCRVS